MTNLDQIKQRLEERAKEVAGDGETVLVDVGTATDVLAWRAEVTWIAPDGRREWTGFKGRLEDLESHMTAFIAVRAKATRPAAG
jgi:hypothetical protein